MCFWAICKIKPPRPSRNLAKEVEYKHKRNQIYASYLYAEEREMSSSISKQYSTTTIINCKISWVPFEFQAYMETAYCQKRKQIDLKVRLILDYWTQIHHVT
jgi:hypothetical protein